MADGDAQFGILTGPTTFTIQRSLPGPIERVWRYLVDGDLRRTWLAAGEMPLAPGATFELIWRNDGLSRPGDARPDGFGEEQRMASRIISVDPPHQLVITWGAGEVSFELEERGSGVLLTIIHTGLDSASRTQIAAGWHVHLDILAAQLEGGEAASFWSSWAARRLEYAARLA